jgi:hypothetical protein
MGKSKSKGMDVNVTAYKWKQLQYRLGGELPPDLKLKMADELTEIQRLNYQMAYGVFNRVWREIVVPTLTEKGIPSAGWGPYKAFTNELLKRGLGLGRQRPSMSIEAIKNKWVNNRLDRDVLDTIVSKILTQGRELKILG